MMSSTVLIIATLLIAAMSVSNNQRIPNAIPVYGGAISVARKVLTPRETENYCQKFSELNAVASILSHHVIQSFDKDILQQNVYLSNLEIIKHVFDACKATKNIEFAEKVWNYITNKEIKNSDENPSQLLYSKLLEVHASQTPPIPDNVVMKCTEVTKQWVLECDIDKSDPSICNQMINIVLNSEAPNKAKKVGVNHILGLMEDLQIIPNEDTETLKKLLNDLSANNDNSAQNRNKNGRGVVSDHGRYLLTQKWSTSPPNYIIKSFRDKIMAKNLVLNENCVDLVYFVLKACEVMDDVSTANDVWEWMTDVESENCLFEPTHILYVTYLKVLESVANENDSSMIYQKAEDILAEWMNKYESRQDSLDLSNEHLNGIYVSRCAVFTEFIKIIVKTLNDCEVKDDLIKMHFSFMQSLGIVCDGELALILRSQGISTMVKY